MRGQNARLDLHRALGGAKRGDALRGQRSEARDREFVPRVLDARGAMVLGELRSSARVPQPLDVLPATNRSAAFMRRIRPSAGATRAQSEAAHNRQTPHAPDALASWICLSQS
jgi:hypothetical protein